MNQSVQLLSALVLIPGMTLAAGCATKDAAGTQGPDGSWVGERILMEADYGDAPDGRLQPDGSVGQVGFPTLLGSDGARVLNTNAAALAFAPAAAEISAEWDADAPDDPDGEPNISKFHDEQPDAENRDDHDNGVVAAELNFADPWSPTLNLEVGAYLKDPNEAGTYYVNALFDQNVDGSWNGAENPFPLESVPARGTSQDLSEEWVVKNLAVELSAEARMKTVEFNIPISGVLWAERTGGSASGPYLRLALTDEPIGVERWHGQGEFAKGEIEDWLIRGFDDPPGLDCEPDRFEFPGVPVFDFAGRDQLDVDCVLQRPAYTQNGDINFGYRFVQDFPKGGKDRIDVRCPVDAEGFVAMPDGVEETPVNCTAHRATLQRDEYADYAVDILTDLEQATDVARGVGSSVTASLSRIIDFVSFTDSGKPGEDDESGGDDGSDGSGGTGDDESGEDGTGLPEERVFEACIGLEGSYSTLNGGLILRLGDDSCTYKKNDGVSEGTFILSGGVGGPKFRPMFFSELGGNDEFERSGTVRQVKIGDKKQDSKRFDGPPNMGAPMTVSVEFSSRLYFEIELSVSTDSEGTESITQRVMDARRLAL